MEITNIPVIFQIIIGIITAFGAIKIYKIIECFINAKTNHRRTDAESINLETDSLVKRYSIMEQRVRELEEKVDELYSIIRNLEVENVNLLKDKMELTVALKESKYNECRRPDDECLKRLPQREICLAKKLLGGTYDKQEESEK